MKGEMMNEREKQKYRNYLNQNINEYFDGESLKIKNKKFNRLVFDEKVMKTSSLNLAIWLRGAYGLLENSWKLSDHWKNECRKFMCNSQEGKENFEKIEKEGKIIIDWSRYN